MDSIIINNKTSNRITASNEIRLDVPTFLRLENMKVALAYLGIYYSWRNITSANNNNKLQYAWYGVVYDVDIPDGFYSINDLSDYLHFVMHKNGHYVLDADNYPVYFITFSSNLTYYSITYDCYPVEVPLNGSNPNNVQIGGTPQLIILNNELQNNLGTNAGTYPASALTTVPYSFNAQNIPQISNITTINVACNLVNNRLNAYSNVMYQFAPTTQYGTYLVIQPYQPIYYNITDGSYSYISLMFFDQDYKPIPIIDRNITATLLFSQSK